MKMTVAGKKNPNSFDSQTCCASARTAVLLGLSFVLGVAVSCGWYLRYVKSKEALVVPETAAVVLSDSTKAILQRLDSPADIMFYSPANPATLPEPLAAFAARVQQLLSEYERIGDGNIRLRHGDPALESSAKTAAGADGIIPFSGKNGEICYLGITISRSGRKEIIPQLSPDWEVALESDLSRAIARIGASVGIPVPPTAQISANPTPMDSAISEELLKAFPDLESRSFEDTAKLLRETALAEFTTAVRAMQLKVQETEKQLAAAQGNQPGADQQAAMKKLRQVQDVEAKKLDEITARLQARIQVLERLKGVSRPLPQ